MRNIVSPLDGIPSPFGGRRFDPRALFGRAEPGIWLDPSDLSTMFQTRLGSTPVTAAGQSVGLILDKSQGLVLGPDLITNGSFDNGTASWASGASFTSTAAVVGGEMQVTPVADFGRQLQTLTLVAGRTYRITGSLRRVSGASVNGAYVAVGYNSQGDSLVIATSSSAVAASFSAVFVPTHATVNISLVARTGNVGGFDNIVVRELAGRHATQATAASRPTYQVDASGRGYLSFDGVDDFLVTPTITPGTDKVQMFAGVRKLSDAAQGVVAELSASTAANNGSFLLAAPDGASATFAFDSKGTTQTDAVATGQTAPLTAVLTGLGDISGDSAILRVNGAVADTDTGDQGTGNYLAYPIYIGRRGGTTLPFNGRVYGLIARFGANLEDRTIAGVERWMNAKTGAF